MRIKEKCPLFQTRCFCPFHVIETNTLLPLVRKKKYYQRRDKEDSSANQVAQVGSKYGGSVQIFCVDFGYEKGLLTETHQFRVVQRDICVSKKYSGNWILIRKQRSIWAEGDDGPDGISLTGGEGGGGGGVATPFQPQ